MTVNSGLKSDSSWRLNKYLALQLGISRREADNLIEQGRVTVNDESVILGARYNTGDTVKLNSKPLAPTVHYQYLILNKPIGYVCSRKAQGDALTIYELLPSNFYNLKTAGRLDKDSSGLILLTNDGDFAYQMTHPKFKKTKQYEVALDADLAPLHQQMISDIGVSLDDGVSQLQLERQTDTNRRIWNVVMSEGRNRQIRRTFASLGYNVISLHRTHFGNYSLGDIPPGGIRNMVMQ